MQAVILVGGEGTRLRPLTYGTPKPMVPLFGVPFLERTFVRLREAGVTDVVLAAGYLPQAIEDYFGDGSRAGLKITYVIEERPLGTAGALKNVEQHLHQSFFVLNGDVLTSLDLRGLAACHAASGGIGTLHAIRVPDPSAFGCIVHDRDGRITAFVEKPARGEAPSDDINAGTYLLERSLLDAIPLGSNVSIERETFPALLAEGTRLYSYVTSDYWLDLGRPEQYLQAHRDVLDGKLSLEGPRAREGSRGTMWRAGSAGIPAYIRAPAFVGDGVSIAPNATVGPYAVVGNGCRIGPHAAIRGTVLWDGVTIDAGAQVEDAILASNVRVGQAAVVTRGAVVGHDAEIASRTVLEENARVTAGSHALSSVEA